MKIIKYFIYSFVLTSFFTSLVYANENQGSAKPTDEDLRAIGSIGCAGAAENNFKLYSERMKIHHFELPDAKQYYHARCGDGRLILQNTLIPGSDLFLKNYIIAIYKKYGKEEVKEIINMQERFREYTLLEEALFLNKCKIKSTRTGLNEIIDYLKRVGGKVREGFCKQ